VQQQNGAPVKAAPFLFSYSAMELPIFPASSTDLNSSLAIACKPLLNATVFNEACYHFYMHGKLLCIELTTY
jgi:hypothetical protein